MASNRKRENQANSLRLDHQIAGLCVVQTWLLSKALGHKACLVAFELKNLLCFNMIHGRMCLNQNDHRNGIQNFVYEGSPTPITTFLSIVPNISIFANISHVSIYGSYEATQEQIFCYYSIASKILGALAAKTQMKVKRLPDYSSIGHVGYFGTGFSCGTIFFNPSSL
ncbi:NADH-ubiquinone oxidoreductase chain 2 [Juglans microcarpa x Juglans regia]|uniref:NADH-ubiquinone oxidoreductase chain 2 n=1 Tax=Juglans microcarpa x Juglans regia TaxID=2249226 RepID=UPI001B7EBB14|nr:NADH-ubiquinone oxidoreductase chain 2 [Juglans microcarpa x Juglans regia]